MDVLFIAAIPPPVTGQSLAGGRLYGELCRHGNVSLINLSKAELRSGRLGISRVRDIMSKVWQVWRQRSNGDLIYFTVSESLAGNIKDLAIYAVCFRRLRRMMIHVHGGSLRKDVFTRSRVLCVLNRFFIQKLGAIVILGNQHRGIFDNVARQEQIKICTNFADDEFFISETKAREKYINKRPLRVLYLSNFIEGKGYSELLEAYCGLSGEERALATIDFAGAFETEGQKRAFVERISRFPALRYHGVVGGTDKQRLLAEAHIFCLPTRLSEGQPISILEAYASGCVVVTTRKGGIPDIFEASQNGVEVEAGSADSVRLALRSLAAEQDLARVGLYNWRMQEIDFVWQRTLQE